MRASEIEPKKLVIFDIDDTLVYTQTKVHVIKDGDVVNSLNSHDFTHYKLKPGEEFDFGDFRNAKEFFDNSKPNIPMMDQLKRDINTGNKVVMVTARADFDDRELFLDTFRKFGVDMNKVHVYRAGNSKQGTTEDRKKAIIKKLLDQDNYTKAIMYDDAKPNLHTFMELKKDHPKTRFYAWHVSLDGNASEYMRETINLGKKEMKIKDIDASLAETATTSAGNIASVANPTTAHFKPKKRGKYGAPEAPQKRNSDGTAKNALDLSNNIMGGKPIKR